MLCFFHRQSSDKIYRLKLYHLLNCTLHSKANAWNIGTCFRFYMQMQVEKTNKAFAYKIYSHFTQQCGLFSCHFSNHFPVSSLQKHGLRVKTSPPISLIKIRKNNCWHNWLSKRSCWSCRYARIPDMNVIRRLSSRVCSCVILVIILPCMAIPVMEFQVRGYKISKTFA